MGRSAEALHHDAVDLTNRGRFGQAQHLLARADALTDDRDLRARIAGTQALIHARSGDLVRAESVALAAWETAGLSDGTMAILAGQLGSIAERAGRLDDADRWLTRAIDALDDGVARANLLVNRGVVGIERRDLARAAADTRAAAEIYAAEGLDVDAAEARHNLGYIDLLRGDVVAALAEMTRAHPVLARASKAGAAISALDRAEVLRDAGLLREAEELFSDAADALATMRMPKERAEAEFALATSLLRNDPVRARRIAASAARRFRRARNERWAVRAEGIEMRARLAAGAVSTRGERVPESARSPRPEAVAALVDALRGHGMPVDATALRLAHELWLARRGRVPAVRTVRTPANAPMDLRLLAHEVRAVRAAARNRPAQARRHARAGLEELLGWQRRFGSLDLQTSVVWMGHGLMGEGLRSAVGSGRPDVVFEWSERARHLTLQVAPLRPPPDPELAAELAELRMLRADGDAWMSDPRATELRNRARQRQWSETGSAQVHGRATLDEVQGALDDATAVISFVYSGEGLSALVVTARRVSLVALGDWSDVRALLPGLRSDLDMAAAVQHGPLAAVVRRSLDERVGALSARLLDPILPAIGDRRLVLTAPGVLNGIPWAMMPALHTRVLTVAGSVSRWLQAGRDLVVPSAAGFAVGPRVPRGAEEARTAAASWRDGQLLDPAAIAGVTGLAERVDVLHVAAHGRHAADNPMFSGLELADGTLFGYDIDLIERVPGTVVLSACEVGRSSVRWGEEAVGMTRIWLHAGARCVIAAPVVVADDDACELLGGLHAGLASGEPPAVALAEAARRTGIRAPFQVHGAGF
ncbi:CHAT domain-containing protein [Microbacterium awajiense]|uniref:CHAT domain-containing protein n=1 Tax=Microbacterium awajiense TaxID=415214 RepID=A0ABP7AJH8_9MICO